MKKIFLKIPLDSCLSEVISSELFPIPYANELNYVLPGLLIDGKYSYYFCLKLEYYNSLLDSMTAYYISSIVNKIEMKQSWIELMNILRTAEDVLEINGTLQNYFINRS